MSEKIVMDHGKTQTSPQNEPLTQSLPAPEEPSRHDWLEEARNGRNQDGTRNGWGLLD